MKEFTITNIFKCWLKMWPITVLLVTLGLVGGFLAVKNTKPVYSAKLSLLIVDNRDGDAAVEYAGLANSDLVTNGILKKAVVDNGCKVSASGTNNIVTFWSSCPTDVTEAKKLAITAADDFTAWAQDIYGTDNFKATKLSGDAIVTGVPVTTSKKAVKIIIPAAVMLAVSMIAAFVHLDYKVSKGNGKKA